MFEMAHNENKDTDTNRYGANIKPPKIKIFLTLENVSFIIRRIGYIFNGVP